MLFPWVAILFPVQKALEHTVKLLVNPPHPSHPFLQGFTLQIFLTLLPRANEFQVCKFPSILTELHDKLYIQPQFFQRGGKVLVPWLRMYKEQQL